jgi:dipeptidyl aminopeptidase/acylaminoacyl peptidase
MLFHGSLDRNVGVYQSQLMASELRDAGKQPELVIYKNLDHYLEDSIVRAEMLEKSAKFLKEKLQIK